MTWNWSLHSLSKRPLLDQRNSFLFSVCHTSRKNNNRIQRSSWQHEMYPQSDPLLSSRRPPRLHPSSDNLRDFTRSDGYKKITGAILNFFVSRPVWMMHMRGRLKGKPPSPFSRFPPYQCWPNNKDFHTSTLCRHWMLSRGPAGSYEW